MFKKKKKRLTSLNEQQYHFISSKETIEWKKDTGKAGKTTLVLLYRCRCKKNIMCSLSYLIE